MSFAELFLIAVALSADAFAVAVCKGLSVDRVEWRHMRTAGFYFGGFQALMPLVGYFLGLSFQELIMSVDHWVAFVLLGVIGGKMILESREKNERVNDSFGPREMLPLSLATSIDALAVGVTFALLEVKIIHAVSLIGVVTFVFSVVGIQVGHAFGSRFKPVAERLGGTALILMGTKILLEHLGII